MSSTTPSSNRLCNVCPKEATILCENCCNTPSHSNDTIITPSYCSQVCQISDLPSHKEQCLILNKRRTLFRAGEIIQSLFYIYRRTFFSGYVKEIIISEDQKTMWIHHYEGMGWNTIWDLVKPVPNELCATEEIEMSLLASLKCQESIAWFYDIINYFLESLSPEIKELHIQTRPSKLEIVQVDPNTPVDQSPFGHCVLSILLPSSTSESYILDITAAQYGNYCHPVIEKAEYMKERVLEEATMDIEEWGGERERYLGDCGEEEEMEFNGGWARVNRRMSGVLTEVVEEWVSEEGLGVKGFLDSDEEGFRAKTKELCSFVKEKLEAALAEAKNSGVDDD